MREEVKRDVLRPGGGVSIPLAPRKEDPNGYCIAYLSKLERTRAEQHSVCLKLLRHCGFEDLLTENTVTREELVEGLEAVQEEFASNLRHVCNLFKCKTPKWEVGEECYDRFL